MEDYAGNSQRSKVVKHEPKAKPEKVVKKVVTQKVVVKKKGLGRKTREAFVEADFRGVAMHVIFDVMLPAAKNMLFDAGNEALGRTLFGEAQRRSAGPGHGSRVTYEKFSNPLNRPTSGITRYAPRPTSGSRVPPGRSGQEYLMTRREEAETVLEQLELIIDQYEVASVFDLNELIGEESSHVDNKWGWTNVANARIRQVREGYILDMPEPEPINQ